MPYFIPDIEYNRTDKPLSSWPFCSSDILINISIINFPHTRKEFPQAHMYKMILKMLLCAAGVTNYYSLTENHLKV